MILMHQDTKEEKINHQGEKTKQRQKRLAQQLRENLRRRKEQNRKRLQKES
ncbi:hypothetical protein V4P56_04945 [Bartonella sp. B35(2025)]